MTKLMGLQFKIVYKKGKENRASDSLSLICPLFWMSKLPLKSNHCGYKR
jgi:hypothetical protein